jgi:tetratricopeptide (TPR) repeat protein
MKIFRIFEFRTVWFALCLAACPGVRAQTAQDLVDLIATGKIAEARQRLARMEKEKRSPEQVLFLRGLLTADGDSAAHVYERFLMLYPASRFGDEACIRLAQHKFAQGLYQSALRPIRQLMQKYPDSPIMDKGLLTAGLCYYNLGRMDSAAVFFKNAAARAPDSDAGRSAKDRLALMGASAAAAGTESKEDTVTAPPVPRYAVQVGAFANQTNAVMRKSFFERAGYPVGLRQKRKDGTTLYLVWIGTFATVDEARQTGEKLKNKYGLSYHLVTE